MLQTAGIDAAKFDIHGFLGFLANNGVVNSVIPAPVQSPSQTFLVPQSGDCVSAVTARQHALDAQDELDNLWNQLNNIHTELGATVGEGLVETVKGVVDISLDVASLATGAESFKDGALGLETAGSGQLGANVFMALKAGLTLLPSIAIQAENLATVLSSPGVQGNNEATFAALESFVGSALTLTSDGVGIVALTGILADNPAVKALPGMSVALDTASTIVGILTAFTQADNLIKEQNRLQSEYDAKVQELLQDLSTLAQANADCNHNHDNNPNQPPDPDNPQPGPTAQTDQPVAIDPNDLVGPAGSGSQAFVTANEVLPYTIDFTNEPRAAAPAQVVTVTERLSENLNWGTFQLGNIGFGGTVIQVPAGLNTYTTEVPLPSSAPGAGPNGLLVNVSASLNTQTGLATWTFTGTDPGTLDIPINPLEGFLPPDQTSPEGEGFVSYAVQPLANDTTGSVINAQGAVVFDSNAPINTPEGTNTIDSSPPTSTVSPLPATTAGTHTVTATYNTTAVASSPPQVTITPAAASAATSFLTWAPPTAR
jgi:hypothetical protein